MKTQIKLLLPLLIFLAFSTAGADDAQNANELGKAMRKDMAINFMCQEYLGGLSSYRVAKLSSITTFTRITGDKNKAVLSIDSFEKTLKTSNASSDLKKRFDKMNLSEIDRMSTCQDMVAESYDKVQVLKAKLGLL